MKKTIKYLGYQEGVIKFYVDEPLNSDIYPVDEWVETEDEYILDGDKYVLNDEAYQEKQAELRETDFKDKFFEIPNYGWYRKTPKGYSSAVESLNVAYNAVQMLQKLPANTLIFYQEPDFTKPEECTEEWLVEHQTKNEEMTIQEFGQFYMLFMTAWNEEMHEITEE